MNLDPTRILLGLRFPDDGFADLLVLSPGKCRWRGRFHRKDRLRWLTKTMSLEEADLIARHRWSSIVMAAKYYDDVSLDPNRENQANAFAQRFSGVSSYDD